MNTYLFLCLLAIPILWNYSSYDGFIGAKNMWLIKYTLGNMGFASNQCFNQLNNLKSNELKIDC